MERTRTKTRFWVATGVLLGALLVLAGCAKTEPGAEREFPDYVYRSTQALRGYQLAVDNQEMLTYIPCYCGCGQDPAFKNLKNCFISDDGRFNSHGANCLVCLEEVEDAMTWKGQGLSVKEIRDRIDAKYEGRGVPTDTAPVEDETIEIP
ncbi:MAG: hypothetical protein HY672_01550 [Chloroflexi bacterium]|nr:hypothetical protein [Chloroflexota bacterium]